MRQPEDLRDVTERVLSGLKADESLKFRILQKAAGSEEKKHAFSQLPVLCSVIVVLMIAVLALNSLKPVDTSVPVEINSFAAGSKDTVSSLSDPAPAETIFTGSSIIPGSVIQIEMSGLGSVSSSDQCSVLFAILAEKAVPCSISGLSPQNIVVITAADGSTLSFYAEEPYLVSETVWSCPEFFEKLYSILE